MVNSVISYLQSTLPCSYFVNSLKQQINFDKDFDSPTFSGEDVAMTSPRLELKLSDSKKQGASSCYILNSRVLKKYFIEIKGSDLILQRDKSVKREIYHCLVGSFIEEAPPICVGSYLLFQVQVYLDSNRTICLYFKS